MPVSHSNVQGGRHVDNEILFSAAVRDLSGNSGFEHHRDPRGAARIVG